VSRDVNGVAGGLDTTRMSAAEQDRVHREARQADALAYLTRRGLDDVAVILGLVPEPCEGCGGAAVRMGYCDLPECAQRRREAARGVSRRALDKAIGAAR
jgi:hypothetical protein